MNRLQAKAVGFIERFNTVNYKDQYELTYPNNKSKYGLSVPRIIFTFTKVKIPKFKLKTFRFMFGSIKEIRKSFKDLRKNEGLTKRVLSQSDYIKIKEYARSVGALDVGFANITPDIIFSNHAVVFDKALVITAEMNKEVIDLAPNRETGHEVHKTYYALAVIVNKVARYMRTLGYKTQANSPLGGDVNFVTLAQKAGMGEIGNHGLLISEKVGPRQRIAGVYIEASLEELQEDRPDYTWIRDFCIKCQKCVRLCPGDAIDGDALKENKTVMIDYKKCAIPFANSTGCSVCIKECVFNNKDLNEVREKATNV
jgi:Pyruvate/2-oxoacid:ferredoxin oxidoreductase delta subunit